MIIKVIYMCINKNVTMFKLEKDTFTVILSKKINVLYFRTVLYHINS